MAKNKAKSTRRPKRKAPHARVICPHCGKTVTVAQPQRFQLAIPCPVCRVPISASLIEATQESGSEEAPATTTAKSSDTSDEAADDDDESEETAATA